MERLKNIKESLIASVQGQMGHLDSVDAKELGEVVDMIKDIEEAIYYCTITKAMEEKEKPTHNYYYTEYYYPQQERDMDKMEGRMYYPGPMYYNGNSQYNGHGNRVDTMPMHNGGGNSARNYTERMMSMGDLRDKREGRSPMSRKQYMEAKEMHHDKATQMKELEKYVQELSKDLVEMVEDASPEEKQLLQQRISALASKIQ